MILIDLAWQNCSVFPVTRAAVTWDMAPTSPAEGPDRRWDVKKGKSSAVHF